MPPPWCILLKGKSPPMPEHTRRVMGVEANWTGQQHMQCTRRPSRQCHIYYVSVLPGITVTMTFPTLPGTGLEPWLCLPAEARPCCVRPLVLCSYGGGKYTPGLSPLVLAFERSHSTMLLSSWSFYLTFVWELQSRTVLRPMMSSY